MSVTLDVSKLRDWLNASAPCRVENRGYDAGRGVVRPGRARPIAVGARARAAGTHIKHAVHVRDAGRVEAQRLVEGRRPEPKKTALIGDRVCISTDNIWEGVGWRQRKRHARVEDPTLKAGGSRAWTERTM